MTRRVALTDDLLDCLRFWSRLPLPPGGTPNLSRSIRVLPVAGVLIALPAAGALLVADAFALPPAVGATLGLLALIVATGALHEDGFADTIDGLFGGSTPDRRLAIMRDSRIGTFGTLALILSVFLRIACLVAILAVSPRLAAASLLAAAAVSRTAGLLPLACLRPARPDGLGASVAMPERFAMQGAFVVAAATLALPVLAGLSIPRAIVAGALAVCGAFVVVPLARAKIGGQTGDIAGASQQLAEMTFLLVLSAGLR